jgi:meiotically up-regulated gene 157 (Mug157) protein
MLATALAILDTEHTSKQSLLSLPYLGFLGKDDETYVATRKLLLSGRNPYFAAGKNISGVG